MKRKKEDKDDGVRCRRISASSAANVVSKQRRAKESRRNVQQNERTATKSGFALSVKDSIRSQVLLYL